MRLKTVKKAYGNTCLIPDLEETFYLISSKIDNHHCPHTSSTPQKRIILSPKFALLFRRTSSSMSEEKKNFFCWNVSLKFNAIFLLLCIIEFACTSVFFPCISAQCQNVNHYCIYDLITSSITDKCNTINKKIIKHKRLILQLKTISKIFLICIKLLHSIFKINF